MAKKTITMTLFVSELVYDIQNKTYLTGRSRQTGTNHEEVANMQANDDDENASQILRSIQNAFGTLKTKLSEWLDEDGTSSTNELINAMPTVAYYKATVLNDIVTWAKTSSASDISQVKASSTGGLPTSGVSTGDVYSVDESKTLVLSLIMPSNYNNATRDTINAALHQYIVNTAIGDWFTITDKADATDYFTLAGNNLETIREAANKRVRPVRQDIVG